MVNVAFHLTEKQNEIVTDHPMLLDEGACEQTLLKGDILYYCQGLVNQFKGIDTLVTDSFHSALPGDKDF